MNPLQGYRFRCTLTFGDIYAQVIIWLIVIFLGLAAAIAMYQNPVYAFLTGGLVLVLSLPFLLFAFVTTLLNHIALEPINATAPQPGSATAPAKQHSGVVQQSS